jgi:hypothetical protein
MVEKLKNRDYLNVDWDNLFFQLDYCNYVISNLELSGAIELNI